MATLIANSLLHKNYTTHEVQHSLEDAESMSTTTKTLCGRPPQEMLWKVCS